MWPAGPLTSNSKRLALPFQTLLTIDVPSYSTHCFEPANGCTRRETWVFQMPKWKSKSCCPSRLETFGFVCVASCALPGCGKLDSTSTTNVKNTHQSSYCTSP